MSNLLENTRIFAIILLKKNKFQAIQKIIQYFRKQFLMENTLDTIFCNLLEILFENLRNNVLCLNILIL